MTEQEKRVFDYMANRYREKRAEFFRARRISPCTKDYIHGRWTEIREVFVGLFGEEASKTIKEIDNE